MMRKRWSKADSVYSTDTEYSKDSICSTDTVYSTDSVYSKDSLCPTDTVNSTDSVYSKDSLCSTDTVYSTDNEPSKYTEHSTGEKSMDDLESITDDGKERPTKKSWIRRLNPFHIGKIPPVPESDVGLVSEMMASWFSKLTSNWMSPLMMVIQLSAFGNFILERLSAPAAKRRPLALR